MELTTPTLDVRPGRTPPTHAEVCHPCSGRYTTLDEMYDFFLAGITDDMFMELTRRDTEEILDEILMAALPEFEFPKKNIFDIDWPDRHFNVRLTSEEMLIIQKYMIAAWIGYQLASIENVRQKYSSSDFSFTSQASHIDKLIKLKKEYEDKGFHLQRLYCRREVNANGELESTMDRIMSASFK